MAFLTIVFLSILSSQFAQAELLYADVEIRGYKGKCLDVRGPSSANGTVVQMWDCVGVSNQRWNVYSNGEIRSRYNLLKCLDIRGASNNNGASLQIWDCVGGTDQKWFFTGDNLRSNYNGKCLDVRGPSSANGTPVQMWSCVFVSNQVFYTNAVPAKYDCDAYVRGDGRSTIKSFNIPVVYTSGSSIPNRGVVVIETFIPVAWVDGPPWIIQGKGDGRTFSNTFDPARTRQYTKLDFNSGKGCMVSNWSQIRDRACSWTSQRPVCWHKTFDSKNVEYHNNAVDAAGNSANWISDDDALTYRYRYHLQNSVWGSRFLTCAIDHTFAISFNGDWANIVGDGYPSVAVYRYKNGSRDSEPITLATRAAINIGNLCDTGE